MVCKGLSWYGACSACEERDRYGDCCNAWDRKGTLSFFADHRWASECLTTCQVACKALLVATAFPRSISSKQGSGRGALY